MKLSSLYEISDIRLEDAVFSARITFDPNHNIFNGHFPGRPVVPGVCLVRIIKDLVSELGHKPFILERISNLKFLNIIDPGNTPEVTCSGTFLHQGNEHIRIDASISYQNTTYLKFKGLFRSL